MTRIRIGNQTAISCADPLEPYHFARQHGFDAFEWFADRKELDDGRVLGWNETDMDAARRAWIRQSGIDAGMLFTVHAPWQANPLHGDGVPLLLRSLDFAADIGAALVNLHLYMDEGAHGYAQALAPVLRRAADLHLRVSIENTPQTAPEDFKRTFACLADFKDIPPGSFGMCLDIGHANLCAVTHNNFIHYLDLLGDDIPIVHVHAHENHGDRDSHLTLFTGPAREDDSGIRAFIERLRRRDYHGAIILEQWPQPPELLVEAAQRLRTLLDRPSGALRRPASNA